MDNLKKITFLEEDYFEIARESMVSAQLIPFGVNHPGLLKAFLAIPREMFLEEPDRQIAYAEFLKTSPLRGFFLPPHFLGRLLQEATLDGQGKALIIGGGEGYSAAILSSLMSIVFLLETHQHLIMRAETHMKTLGIDNVFPVAGCLEQGLPGNASYDLILIEGAVEEIPTAVLNQVAIGGVLLTFLRHHATVKEAVSLRRVKGGWKEKIIFQGNVPVLQAFAVEKEMTF